MDLKSATAGTHWPRTAAKVVASTVAHCAKAARPECPSLKKRIFSTNELMEIAIVKRDQTLAEHPRGPILWEGATGTLKPKKTRVFDEQTIGSGNYRA